MRAIFDHVSTSCILLKGKKQKNINTLGRSFITLWISNRFVANEEFFEKNPCILPRWLIRHSFVSIVKRAVIEPEETALF